MKSVCVYHAGVDENSTHDLVDVTISIDHEDLAHRHDLRRLPDTHDANPPRQLS